MQFQPHLPVDWLETAMVRAGFEAKGGKLKGWFVSQGKNHMRHSKLSRCGNVPFAQSEKTAFSVPSAPTSENATCTKTCR